MFLYTVSPYGVNITGNNTYPRGSQLQLHCSSEGGPQLEYSWSRTNTLSNDTTTNTNNLTISNVTTLDGGNYTCTVTNVAGSSSDTVTVYGELVHNTYLFNCWKFEWVNEFKMSFNVINSWTSVHYSSNESGGGY